MKQEEHTDIIGDLVVAIRHETDGYEIAKSLERIGWEPDAELVEIVSEAFSKKKAVLDKACEEWVRAYNIKEIPVGTKVKFILEPGLGTVTDNMPSGKSVVAYDRHAKGGGCVVEWERLSIVTEAQS